MKFGQCKIGTIPYLPPYDWPTMLAFFASHATIGVEAVVDGQYVRSMRLGAASGWFVVSNDAANNQLILHVSPGLARASAVDLAELLALTARAFDTNLDPQSVSAHLGPLAAANPGLRLPGVFDGFEAGVRTILGQQVTVRAGSTMAGRVARCSGEEIATPFATVTHLTPTASCLAAASTDSLTALGVIASRARAIVAFAQAVESGLVNLSTEADNDASSLSEALVALPGIGPWTAQYLSMRLLSMPDSFPARDLVVKKALGESDEKKILLLAEKWRPWRSYAALHLWKSVAKSLQTTALSAVLTIAMAAAITSMLAQSLPSFAKAPTQVPTAQAGYELDQITSLNGKYKVTVSHDAVRVDQLSYGYSFISRAPLWDVIVFRQDSKKYAQLSYKEWLNTNQVLVSTLWTMELKKPISSRHFEQNGQGYIAYIFPNTEATGGYFRGDRGDDAKDLQNNRGEVTCLDFPADVHAGSVAGRAIGLPQLVGVPVQATRKSARLSSWTLRTVKTKRSEIAAQVFTLPAGYTKVPFHRNLFSSTKQKEDVDDLFGIGSK